jgi:hypothetical protein
VAVAIAASPGRFMSDKKDKRVIEHSGHDIERDQPHAVIDAVDAVLRQLHATQNSAS